MPSLNQSLFYCVPFFQAIQKASCTTHSQCTQRKKAGRTLPFYLLLPLDRDEWIRNARKEGKAKVLGSLVWWKLCTIWR